MLHLRKFNYPDDVILIKWSLYLSLKYEYIFKTLDDSKSEETVEGKENYQRNQGWLNMINATVFLNAGNYNPGGSLFRAL